MKDNSVLQFKITQITEKLEKAWTSIEIIKYYSQHWDVSTRTVERYIALAKDILSTNLKNREKVIDAVRADIIASEAETWLKSNMELEARLCAIITGKVRFRKTMKKGSNMQDVFAYPSCSDVISAIDVLLKLRGVYKSVPTRITENNPMRIIVDNESEKKIVENIIQQAFPGYKKSVSQQPEEQKTDRKKE